MDEDELVADFSLVPNAVIEDLLEILGDQYADKEWTSLEDIVNELRIVVLRGRIADAAMKDVVALCDSWDTGINVRLLLHNAGYPDTSPSQ